MLILTLHSTVVLPKWSTPELKISNGILYYESWQSNNGILEDNSSSNISKKLLAYNLNCYLFSTFYLMSHSHSFALPFIFLS